MITMAGMIGVGKTTYTQHMAKMFQAEPLFEEVSENPILDAYYSEPTKYLLHGDRSVQAALCISAGRVCGGSRGARAGCRSGKRITVTKEVLHKQRHGSILLFALI